MPAHSQGKYLFQGKVEEYDDRFLTCRDIGHHWIPNPHWEASYHGRRVIEYRRTCLCANCECRRHDYYDGQMQLVGRHYAHSPGYIVGREVEITPASARLEQIRRHGIDAKDRKPRRLRAVS